MEISLLIVVIDDGDEYLLPYRSEDGTLRRTSLSVALGSVINTRNVATTKYSTMGYYERVRCTHRGLPFYTGKRVRLQATLIEPFIRSAAASLVASDREKYDSLKSSNQYEYCKAVLSTMRKMEGGGLLMNILKSGVEDSTEKNVDSEGNVVPSNSSDV